MKEYWNILTTEEIKRKILTLIESDDWENAFCVGSDGKKRVYACDEKSFAKKVAVGVGLTMYNEEVALHAIREVLRGNVDEIAAWIPTRRASLRMFIEFPAPVGIMQKAGHEAQESNVAQVSLHREIGDNTQYGFFVSTVLPYFAEN